MSNIFISHSSVDKPFIKKLAFALLADGFPVWLDTWQLEAGDSLIDNIYEGIEGSSVLLLGVSQRSSESGWVSRELNAALSMEARLGRKFIIPLKLDNGNIPLKIADRLYIDFSSEFSRSFGRLVATLEKLGARDLVPPLEREVIPVSFTKAVHLDMSSLSTAIEHRRRRHGSLSVEGSQVVTATDSDYDELLERLHTRVDKIADDPFYSPQLEQNLRSDLADIQKKERYLRNGIATLCSNYPSVDAAYWFARILRGQIAYALWATQTPGQPNVRDYGKEWDCARVDTNSSAARFFEVEGVSAVKLTSARFERSGYFYLWISTKELRYPEEDLTYLGPQPVHDVCSYAALDKYVFPQVLLKHLQRGTGPIPWDLEQTFIELY